MDSFKYATSALNQEIHDTGKEYLLQSMLGLDKLLGFYKRKDTSEMSTTEQLQIELESKTLENNLNYYNITQTPWILNAPVAMNTRY